MLAWFRHFFTRHHTRRLSPQEGYDCWAECYDADARNPVVDLEEQAMAGILPALEGKRVLDAGCGTGRSTRRARDRGAADVFSVDASGEMLARARRSGCTALLQADLCALPLADTQFDVVISTFVLEHVRNFALAVMELSRVTVPGGTIVLADFHPFGAFAGWNRSFRRHDGRRWRVYTIERTPHLYEEYVRACRCAGLIIEDVIEPRIDESVRSYFEAEGSLDAYAQYRGFPLVLLLKLRKNRHSGNAK